MEESAPDVRLEALPLQVSQSALEEVSQTFDASSCFILFVAFLIFSPFRKSLVQF